ncbi:MAG: translocation/assembly module TamB domain-containing protein [Bacteroidota bacterium]
MSAPPSRLARLLRWSLALVALVGLVFLGLTRTQVGRDGIRQALEYQANERLQGRLSIGTLRGNLLNELYAQDVRLYGPEGDLVLQVDSVYAAPRWQTLFTETLSFRRVHLERPRAWLRRQPDGTWSLRETFRRADGRAAHPGWSLAPTAFSLTEGRVLMPDGPPPAPVMAGRPAWTPEAVHLDSLNATGLLEVDAGYVLLDLSTLNAAVRPADLNLVAANTRLEFSGSNRYAQVWAPNVQLGQSRAGLEAELDFAPDRALADQRVRVQVEDGVLQTREVQQLVPALPNLGQVRVEGDVRGPIRGLVIPSLTIATDSSRLTLEGTIDALPRTADVDAAATFALSPTDLERVRDWFETPPLTQAGTLTGELALQSQWPLDAPTRPAEATATGRLATDLGRVEGQLSLTRDTLWALQADVQVDQLDVGLLAGQAPRTHRISGQLRGAMESPRESPLQRLAGSLDLDLSPSVLGGLPVEALALQAELRDETVAMTGRVQALQGQAQWAGSYAWNTSLPTFQAEVDAVSINLAPFLAQRDVQTALNGRLLIDGQGTRLDTLIAQASLQLDSSRVTRGDSILSVVPQRHRLTVNTVRRQPQVVLEGDALEATVTSDRDMGGVVPLATYWRGRLSDALEDLRRIRLNPEVEASPASLQLPLSEALAGSALVQADLRLINPALLVPWSPRLAALEGTPRAEGSLFMDEERFRFDGMIEADTVRVDSLRLSRPQVVWEWTSRASTDLATTSTATLVASADALTRRGLRTQSPSVLLTYDDRFGQIQLDGTTPAGRLRLDAGLDLLPDINRLTVNDFVLDAAGDQWRLRQTGVMDLYSDGVEVKQLELVGQPKGELQRQRVELRGTLSRYEADALNVELDNVVVQTLSALVGLRRPFGGVLSGSVALTGGLQTPDVSGQLQVNRFSFDNRLLGTLSLDSRLRPGTRDATLDLRLQSPEAWFTRPAPPLTLYGSSRIAEPIPTDLRLAGSFRLPSLAPASGTAEPGALDLEVTMGGLDAFFFEYLFSAVDNVEGTFSGAGRIGGTFRRPVFDVSTTLAHGRVAIPRFNTVYDAEGEVDVTREGFVVRRLEVSDPSQGVAALSGRIDFNEYRFFSFDLEGTLDDLRILDVPRSDTLAFYGSLIASGEATLRGPVYAATLRSSNARLNPRSEVLIPVEEDTDVLDPGFIIFTDSTGALPDLDGFNRRRNILERRPVGERTFVDGLAMDLNVFAPQGTTLRLIFDELLGDVITAVGTGRVQFQRREGRLTLFGSAEINDGDYLFTAGEVFARRFLINGGTLSWDGDPIDARLDIDAAYRTRASLAGLEDVLGTSDGQIPLIVALDITGRVSTPAVELSLELDRSTRTFIGDFESLQTILNNPDRSTEYATSVLLTNSFLLTTSLTSATNTGSQLAFNSLSQLVASQLNRYVNAALPNLDVTLGVQQGLGANDLDLTYGVALRLLDERLVIRGEGVYENQQTELISQEYAVEIRLSSAVSLEVFLRQEDAILGDDTLTNTGAGLSYQTRFPTWRRLWNRLFGRRDRPESPRTASTDDGS